MAPMQERLEPYELIHPWRVEQQSSATLAHKLGAALAMIVASGLFLVLVVWPLFAGP